MLRSVISSCALASVLLAAAQATYDARILDYTGLRFACEGSASPVLRIQNAGSATMGSCVVETWSNGLMVNTFNWTLAVPALQGEVRQPVLPVVPDLEPGDVLEFRIISVNGIADEDPNGNIMSVPLDVPVVAAGSYVMGLVLSMAAAPDSLTWAITNGAAQVVAQGGPYTTGDEVEQWVQLMPEECYMLRLAEVGGDPVGGAQLSVFVDGTPVTVLDAGTAAAPARSGIITGLAMAQPDRGPSALQVYPNPAADVLHLRLPNAKGELRYRLIDATGRVVLERAAVQVAEGLSIDLGRVPAGHYALEAQAGQSAAQRTRVVVQR